VERDAHQKPGSKLGPGASVFHQRIISNNSYTHDEQGDNLGQEKEGSTVYSIIHDGLLAVSRLSAAQAWLKLTGTAGHWLV